jgi:hypothetical protein
MLQGNWERAEELYRRGIQLDPSQQQELVACQIGEWAGGGEQKSAGQLWRSTWPAWLPPCRQVQRRCMLPSLSSSSSGARSPVH